MGSVPGMTALVEAGAGARVPMVRDALPLSRQLIEHLRSTDLKASSPVERDAGRVNVVSHRHGRWQGSVRICVLCQRAMPSSTKAAASQAASSCHCAAPARLPLLACAA